jgi:hypothetical protein
MFPSHPNEEHMTVKREFPLTEAVHVTPSYEYASLLTPTPPATHLLPFHATTRQDVVKIEVPDDEPFHIIPSYE